MPVRSITALVSPPVAIIAGGAVFFRHVEGRGWTDALFFTVLTLSTVGHGNIVPATEPGKIATTVLIFAGPGIFALAIQQFAMFAIRRREGHAEWLIGMLRHAPPVEEEEQDQKATADTPPDDEMSGPDGL